MAAPATARTNARRQMSGEASPLMGIFLMVTAVSTFPVLDAIAKYFTDEHHVVQIVWARYLFQTLAVAAVIYVMLRRPLRVLHTHRLGLQAVRAAIMIFSNLLFVGSLVFLSLADAIILLFVGPLMVTALSAPMLGEKVGPRRWAAVAVGFAGALIVIRPGFGVFQWAALMPLGTALLFAFYQITTRMLAATDHPMTTLFYTSFVGLLVVSLPVPWFWAEPQPVTWVMMAVMGILAVFGHFVLIKAYDFAEVATLAPFAYLQIVMGALLSYLVFGDFPDFWSWVGTAVIVGSGMYVAYRENRAKRAALQTVEGGRR